MAVEEELGNQAPRLSVKKGRWGRREVTATRRRKGQEDGGHASEERGASKRKPAVWEWNDAAAPRC